MYFLAKNIRTCSKYFRGTPDKFKLYKDGVLNWRYLARNVSYFMIHPEQIKQKLKEQDAHVLCQFFDSVEYKSKVTQFLEMQGRILSKDTIAGIKPPGTIKYQHVLSCAQPFDKKAKIVSEDVKKPEIKVGMDAINRKLKKGTIFDEIKRRKGIQDPDSWSIKSEARPKSFRQKTTIMPIFLKKIKQKRQDEELQRFAEEPQNLPDFNCQTARRVKRLSDGDSEPMYAQILHKTNVYRTAKQQVSHNASKTAVSEGVKSQRELHSSNVAYKLNTKMESSQAARFKSKTVQSSMEIVSPSIKILKSIPTNKPRADHLSYRLHKTPAKPKESPMKLGEPSNNIMPLRMASSIAKITPKQPTIKLLPRRSMNLKSYSDLLCTAPIKSRKNTKQTNAKGEDEENIKIEVLNPSKQTTRIDKTNELILGLPLRALKFQNNLENRTTLMQVLRNKEAKKCQQRNNELVVTSLFKKVKLGTSNNVPSSTTTTTKGILRNIILEPKFMETPKEIHKKTGKEHESFTYKIVARNRERREAKLRETFKINPPYWQNKFSYSFGRPGNEVEEISTKSRLLNFEETSQQLRSMSRNIPKYLHRPVPHFVEHPNKPKTVEINQYYVFSEGVILKRYLIRLPKTTPEGYRVLLYAVRDPDPTKMNFNDVVKGFCMYNDCVLSEDGLQEGYVVIFDMRDVSIGHLARVSLPALKCFMYYIQDAHPCRIKQIHVLNTASWIQHVMRLVVPLVRSELLNLVKFHKGSIPEGLPVELLPMEYGGEAPTVEELDNTTKSLLDKYRDWLIESAHFKADESKRVKKANWWGLFSSKSPQEVELDEKTILKNLQID